MRMIFRIVFLGDLKTKITYWKYTFIDNLVNKYSWDNLKCHLKHGTIFQFTRRTVYISIFMKIFASNKQTTLKSLNFVNYDSKDATHKSAARLIID